MQPNRLEVSINTLVPPSCRLSSSLSTAFRFSLPSFIPNQHQLRCLLTIRYTSFIDYLPTFARVAHSHSTLSTTRTRFDAALHLQLTMVLVFPSTTAEKAIRVPFYTIQILSASLLSILLLIFFLQKKKRHPTLINVSPFESPPVSLLAADLLFFSSSSSSSLSSSTQHSTASLWDRKTRPRLL